MSLHSQFNYQTLSVTPFMYKSENHRIMIEMYILSIMYSLFYETNYVDITKEKQI